MPPLKIAYGFHLGNPVTKALQGAGLFCYKNNEDITDCDLIKRKLASYVATVYFIAILLHMD